VGVCFMDTLRFLRQRALHLIPVLLGITLIVFFMLRLIPGDPARLMLGIRASPEQVAELRTALGLDKPIWTQYMLFLGDLVQGDLGISLKARRPVLAVAFEKVPVTLMLVGYSALLSLVVTVPLATLAALRRNSLIDQVIRGFFTFTLAMPGFWLGLILLILFAVQNQWFPIGGFGRTLPDRLWHLFLPALTITLSLAPQLIRNMRSGVIDVLKAPYIEFARAKGLSEGLILRRHILRNALISAVTILGLNIGYLLGGSVVIETVFTLPGLGSLMVSSIFARDYPMVQGITLTFGVLVIAVNLITDLTYAFLDPRVTYD